MLIDKLEEHLVDLIEELGFIFWGIELESKAKKGPLVRVYIDHEEGIGVDDCQAVSRQISAVLDVEDIIPSAYTLEVSSPGSDRRIFTLAQAKSLEGFQVQVRLTQAIENKRRFKATLQAVVDNKLELLMDDEVISVDFNDVDKLRIVPQW